MTGAVTGAAGDVPFVMPREATAADAIAEIGSDLEIIGDDGEAYYEYIIDNGRVLPAMPKAWCDDAHRLNGCLAQVWMHDELQDGKLFLAGASDSTIVNGLVSLVLRVYSGRTPAEILETDPVFLKELGLIRSLTANRSNGVDSMARAIQDAARRSA